MPDGVKYDGEKPRWDLLPYESLEEVVKVLTYGAKKYSDDNWKVVPDIDKRYFAAAMRHLAEWKEYDAMDEESGLSHLAHATCCLLFLLWKEQQ